MNPAAAVAAGHRACNALSCSPARASSAASSRPSLLAAGNGPAAVAPRATGTHLACRPRRASALRCSRTLVVTPRTSNPKFRQLQLDGVYDVPAPEDFYSLLRLDHKTSPPPEAIKAAYRQLQRVVHPDLVGPSATPMAVILNACYETLMDNTTRATYDFELQQYMKGVGSFDGRTVSVWMGDVHETRAVFVAENECIGCRQCTMISPKTFVLEEEHGRARVSKQWADDEDSILQAVESCPVDCIYFVDKSQLALLEFVMKSCKRESSFILLRRRSGNMGSPPSNECPFTRAVTYIKARKDARVEEAFGDSRGLTHDHVLAAAIARAWLELPQEVRDKGWPEWSTTF